MTLQEKLKQSGYSLTQQRQQLFDLLQKQEPLTMQQLVQRTKQIDRASVYRSVALFERLGIINRLYAGWKYKIELSDVFTAHHHHLTCLRCHTIIPINAQKMEQLITQVANEQHFVPTNHQIEIQGYCAVCQYASPGG